jgi:hypothetical protein
VLLTTSALAWGCNSTGVGNPPRTETVSLAIVADDEPEVTEPADGGTAEPSLERGALRHAVLVFGEIRWLPCDPAGTSTVTPGPIAVDLITGETRPALGDVEVPEGGLCGFDAPLAPAQDSAELQGRSLFFSGVRADGVPFLLFANVRATLRVRARAGEAWGAQGPLALLWALQPRRWASAMELSDAMDQPYRGSGRIIVIDVNRNPLLYDAVRARLAARSTVFVDNDSDGFLDDSERSRDVGGGSDDVEP